MSSPFPAIDQALQRLRAYQLDTAARLPDDIELDRLQMQIGCTLPTDYRYFLTSHGPGGLGVAGSVPLPDHSALGARFDVDILYGVGARDDWDPFSLLQSTYGGVIPDGYLPIANDPGGNLLLLQCGTGAIFAWDHEHRELDFETVERRIQELEAGGLDVSQYDLGQLILMWEHLHPELVENATGHGNLYPVADSFGQLLERLGPDVNDR